MAALLPFTWPLMTSMSIVATWNAILWWQAVAVCLAFTPPGEFSTLLRLIIARNSSMDAPSEMARVTVTGSTR